ncbi:ATP-dependent RNA helicase dhx29 [Patella vulgata]|uniref:ATP-dependent RNA helicase dhx29 n=1 Tax=Patella vulgata TaxID=6465 RepID=UPI0021806AC1|nr:ATP-dependent RNA helicase dhx29 [Patella vulgata]
MASKNKKSAKPDVVPKTYKSENSSVLTDTVEQAEDHMKVSIQKKLETDILNLIQDETQHSKSYGELSRRLTSRKLADVYNSLSGAGFQQKQIENAMNNTIMKGGDLITALDWLCLNIPNDQLPTGFSETLLREEEKKRRPQFDQSLQVQKTSVAEGGADSQNKSPTKKKKKGKNKNKSPTQNKGGGMKNWILQYAEQSSSESEGEDGPKVFNPNPKYISLQEKLEDAKEQASLAKQQGKESINKKLSKTIREFMVEMAALETHPDFDASLKKTAPEKSATDNNIQQANNGATSATPVSNTTACNNSIKSTKDSSSKNKDDDEMGFVCFDALEEQAAKAPPSVPKSAGKGPVEEVRNFEYTRQQWTGKSPKQFLIDWVRKHLPKSDPPKYSKIQLKMNRFKSKVRINKMKDGSVLELVPNILCENVKDAEHLASTLALYQLCKGQPIHQVLPPPYRDVWLDWLEADKTKKQDAIDKENKPRDQYIAKLMKKLKLDNNTTSTDANATKSPEDEERETTWEDLVDEDIDIKPEPKKTKNKGKKTRMKLNGEDIFNILDKNEDSTQYKDLYSTRQQLPVFKHKDIILDKLVKDNVIVIAGETGSGKSTQVPQFILQDLVKKGDGEKCNIVCTQPRRISAISLATRVSQELGEYKLGQSDSLCGYQIRFESKKNMNTKLLYCTTGVILRQLQNNPNLDEITHIIIDEVHERSVQSDFLLIVVKKLLTKRQDLKVILMSATLDSQKFSSYFQYCPVINIPGRTFPVEIFHVEDAIEMCGYIVDDDSKYTYSPSQLVQEESANVEVTVQGGESTKMDVHWTKENISRIDRTDLSAEKYCLRTRNAVTRLNHNRINMDLIIDLIKYLGNKEPYCDMEGAILIFLPGLADIQELNEVLTTEREFSDRNRYQILALHSVLSSGDQTRAFNIPPPGVRKVVLATNIAETGITIPDVIFVIDSGKVKETRYIETKQMSSLEEVFISKANAKQRQGRAGRVQNGFCFRLFTQAMYEDFKAYTIPEILRVPLEELCLNIMKCNFGHPVEFLSQGLDPPHELSVIRAMDLLRAVGACEEEGNTLTPLGHHLAALPVHVRIGKMLLYSAVFGCLEQVAVIAATMTDKSPFVVPLGKREGADVAKQALSISLSDHLTLYRAFIGWKKAQNQGRNAEETYCRTNFLKRNTLLDIENVKNDLIKLVGSIGFDTMSGLSKSTEQLDTGVIAMVKAVLTAGLYPNVGRVSHTPPVDACLYPDKKLCIVETQHASIAIHPSSVNRYMETNGWLIYHEKVKLARVYLRDVTLISPFPLLLFGGAIDVQHTQQLVTVDNWIKFKTYARTGVIFKELRNLLSDLLQSKLENPTLNFSGNELVCIIQKLLQSEKPQTL